MRIAKNLKDRKTTVTPLRCQFPFSLLVSIESMTSTPLPALQMEHTESAHLHCHTKLLTFQMRFVNDTRKGLTINIPFNNPLPSRCRRLVVCCLFRHADTGPHFVLTLPPPKILLCPTWGHSGRSSFCQHNGFEGHWGFIVDNPQQSTDNVKMFLRISFKIISHWSFHKAKHTK